MDEENKKKSIYESLQSESLVASLKPVRKKHTKVIVLVLLNLLLAIPFVITYLASKSGPGGIIILVVLEPLFLIIPFVILIDTIVLVRYLITKKPTGKKLVFAIFSVLFLLYPLFFAGSIASGIVSGFIFNANYESKEEKRSQIRQARDNEEHRQNTITLDKAKAMLRKCEVSRLDVYKNEQGNSFEYSLEIKSGDGLTKYYTSNKPVGTVLNVLRNIAYESQNKCGIVEIENLNSLGEINSSYIDLQTTNDLFYLCRARIVYQKPVSKKDVQKKPTGKVSDIILYDNGEWYLEVNIYNDLLARQFDNAVKIKPTDCFNDLEYGVRDARNEQ